MIACSKAKTLVAQQVAIRYKGEVQGGAVPPSPKSPYKVELVPDIKMQYVWLLRKLSSIMTHGNVGTDCSLPQLFLQKP